MPNLRTELPPMNSMVVFEAAARHLSFTRAAEELGISREAVSRHIRILEEHLGTPLFLRLYRALELTDAGRRFGDAVDEALHGLLQGTRAVRGGETAESVVVNATIALSSFWLTPRLPRFRELQPGTRIRVTVSDWLPNLAREKIHLGLRYGDGQWRDLNATRLFDVESYLVCSPDYLAAAARLEESGDLPGHTLLNLEGASHASEDWTWFLRGQGVEPTPDLQILGFDSYANVIQAALEGQGIALAFRHLVDELVHRGSLVRPVEASLSRGLAVFLVIPHGASLPRPARALADWILEEGAACAERPLPPVLKRAQAGL